MSEVNGHSDHGSFLTGFTVGMFAGAVGFFLFGTHKGGRVRKTLTEEWAEAQAYLENEGVVERGRSSLRDVFRSIFKNIEAEQKPAPVKAKPSRAKTSSQSAEKPVRKKFKGT